MITDGQPNPNPPNGYISQETKVQNNKTNGYLSDEDKRTTLQNGDSKSEIPVVDNMDNINQKRANDQSISENHKIIPNYLDLTRTFCLILRQRMMDLT
eukprot:UN08658